MGEFQGYTIPAPTGGLNLVDRIDQMPENDARDISNFYSDGQTVFTRLGIGNFETFSAGNAGRSAANLVLGDGTNLLIATLNNKFYKFPGAPVDNVTGATVPTSNDWNMGMYWDTLYACNGVDTAQFYTGTGTFTNLTFTGVTLSTLINVNSYKSRLYFVEKDSTSIWYGEPNIRGTTLTPALAEFDVGSVLRLGGKVIFSGSFTDRLSSTSDDLFMVCSSEGELLFYSGSYPGDAAWKLVANHRIGRPMGYRAVIRVENDVWIITDRGIVPVSMLFNGGTNVALNSVGRKINKLICEYAERVGFNHIWHGLFWPKGRRVFIVIPNASSVTDTFMLVCNIETGAWFPYEYSIVGVVGALTEYYGIVCSIGLNGEGYNHESGFGYSIDLAYHNDDSLPIVSSFKGAYSFYGNRGNFKHFKDVRPLIYTKRGINISIGIDTNFKETSSISTFPITSGKTTPTGAATGTLPGSTYEYLFDRHTLVGQGHSAALKVETSLTNVGIDFSAFEVRFEVGAQV